MNAKIVMFSILVAISSLLIFLQVWLLMLDINATNPIWLLIGGMGVVGGLLNIRRERMQ